LINKFFFDPKWVLFSIWLWIFSVLLLSITRILPKILTHYSKVNNLLCLPLPFRFGNLFFSAAGSNFEYGRSLIYSIVSTSINTWNSDLGIHPTKSSFLYDSHKKITYSLGFSVTDHHHLYFNILFTSYPLLLLEMYALH
jgi:hypothetical protein